MAPGGSEPERAVLNSTPENNLPAVKPLHQPLSVQLAPSNEMEWPPIGSKRPRQHAETPQK